MGGITYLNMKSEVYMKLCIPKVKSFFRSVSSRYMPVVRIQGCTGFVKRIVKIKIEMMCLQTGDEIEHNFLLSF